MKTFLLVAAGTAGAFYFFDARKGKKRRKELKKSCREVAKVASGMFEDYSGKFGDRAHKLSGLFQERARHYGQEAKVVGSGLVKNGTELVKNGNRNWSPSARFVGALGSALAFYGAGRSGVTGTLLRTLSLGLFTRALLASR